METFLIVLFMSIILNLIIGIKEYRKRKTLKIFLMLMSATIIFIILSILSFKNLIPFTFEGILFLYVLYYLMGLNVILKIFIHK